MAKRKSKKKSGKSKAESQQEESAGTSVEAIPVAEEELQADEPAGEASAEIVSPDPGGELLQAGELHAALEAVLFSSPDPLSVTKLSKALGDVPSKDVRKALIELGAEYDEQQRGIRLIEVAGGFQMATREKFSEHILRLGAKKKQAALSGAMLETLAIIAYRQPVIRAVVESIRGVESSGVMRNLLDLGMIEVVGRKEVIGRPQMYGTTEKFLRTFGLRDLKELPSIRGLREKLEAEEAAAAEAEREAREAAEAEEAEEPDEEAPADETSDVETAEGAVDESPSVESQDEDEDDPDFEDDDESEDDDPGAQEVADPEDPD